MGGAGAGVVESGTGVNGGDDVGSGGLVGRDGQGS